MNMNIENLHTYMYPTMLKTVMLCAFYYNKKEKNTTIVSSLIKRLDQQF